MTNAAAHLATTEGLELGAWDREGQRAWDIEGWRTPMVEGQLAGARPSWSHGAWVTASAHGRRQRERSIRQAHTRASASSGTRASGPFTRELSGLPQAECERDRRKMAQTKNEAEILSFYY